MNVMDLERSSLNSWLDLFWYSDQIWKEHKLLSFHRQDWTKTEEMKWNDFFSKKKKEGEDKMDFFLLNSFKIQNLIAFSHCLLLIFYSIFSSVSSRLTLVHLFLLFARKTLFVKQETWTCHLDVNCRTSPPRWIDPLVEISFGLLSSHPYHHSEYPCEFEFKLREASPQPAIEKQANEQDDRWKMMQTSSVSDRIISWLFEDVTVGIVKYPREPLNSIEPNHRHPSLLPSDPYRLYTVAKTTWTSLMWLELQVDCIFHNKQVTIFVSLLATFDRRQQDHHRLQIVKLTVKGTTSSTW